jgi:hypothetical protein
MHRPSACSGSSTTAPRTPDGLDRPARRRLPEPAPDPRPVHASWLNQVAQGAHPARLRLPGGTGRAAARIRPPLPRDPARLSSSLPASRKRDHSASEPGALERRVDPPSNSANGPSAASGSSVANASQRRSSAGETASAAPREGRDRARAGQPTRRAAARTRDPRRCEAPRPLPSRRGRERRARGSPQTDHHRRRSSALPCDRSHRDSADCDQPSPPVRSWRGHRSKTRAVTRRPYERLH